MLCEMCLDIFRGPYPVGSTKHHSSYQSLQRSALEKCDLCRIFWEEIPRMYPLGIMNTQISTEFEFSHYEDLGYKILLFRATLPPHTRDWAIICEPTEGNQNLGADEPSNPSDWSASMACARNWLAGCMENHAACPASRSSQRTLGHSSGTTHPKDEPIAYLPTRLLEIGQPEASKVRLKLSSELDPTSSHYATLSHCWGKSQTLRLTSSSFQRFKDGLEVSELAKTFQDAIFTAQALGIKLLWIDSFCILQDSREDWHQEAGLMSQVYRNSSLNIAASIAIDSDVGFLRERASTVEPNVVQTAWTDYPNDTYQVYNENYWFENFEHMPLSQRAWIFQEVTLAPRVLHFCGTQMFWECHDLKACETWPTKLPKYMYMHSMNGNTWPVNKEIFGWKSTNNTGTLGISTDKNSTLNATSVRSLWRKLVGEYSSCDLTFPSDKLIALSGVARHMERVLNVEYCAGLWSFDLISGLAWYILRESNLEHVFPEHTKSIPYRAPSWSWACVDGPIASDGYWQTEAQVLVDIISYDVETATGERTGAVTSAMMQLSGYLATIELHSDFGKDRRHPEVGKNFDIYCDGKWHNMGRYNFEFDRYPWTFLLHWLPLFIDEFGYLCALLLTPVRRPSTRGHFQRVGMFRRNLSDTISPDQNQLSQFQNESWFQYESAEGDGKYKITII